MQRTAWSVVYVAIAVAMVLVAVVAPPLRAQGPDPRSTSQQGGSPRNPTGALAQLTYQGRLTTNTGAPVNSAVQLVFKLYNDAGGLVWTSAARTITPANGLFTVYLGQDPDPGLPGGALAASASIGVTVGSDPEMTPHQPLNSIVGHSANSVGVVGSSVSQIGVWGISQDLYGVNAVSTNSSALAASSAGGTRNNAAIRANNTKSGDGMAGYFTNNSASPNTQFGNAGAGEVLYLQNGYNGTSATSGTGGGPFIKAVNSAESATLFQVDHAGNVSQVRDATGLVKAGVMAYCQGTGAFIVRSFNNVAGTISIADGGSAGTCTLDFGFQVDDRYWSVNAGGQDRLATCWYGSTSTKLNCYRLNSAGTYVDGAIMVMIY